MKKTLIAACVSALTLAAVTTHATTANAVLDKVGESVKASQDSQVRIDRLADDARGLFDQYSTDLKIVQGLEVYSKQLQQQIDQQNEELASINASIDNVTDVERQLMPLMLDMIDSLEAFVELDLPFSLVERRDRIAFLRDTMNQANVGVSEKLRQVLEAYQVEIDYGRKIEAYRDTLTINGQQKDVDILRVGRTTLAFQSMDKLEQGVWNPQTKEWQNVDASFRSSIKQGIQIAKQIVAPDLMNLPIVLAEEQ